MIITEDIIRRIARQEFGQMAKSGAYTRGSGGGGSYILPVAADGTLGGVKLGYTQTGRNYPVQLDGEKAYVNVPWTAVSFGTDGDDYVPITIGSATKNVLTAHQSLAGYATESWVNQNFITVEWFDKLFKLYNGAESDANKIAPNGTLPSDPANLNIEAMFGFWTEQYISALGNGGGGGGGGGGASALYECVDVDRDGNKVLGAATGKVLTYSSDGKWYAASIPSPAWGDITGKPSTFTPSAHNHAWSDITSGVPTYATRWPKWSEVTDKPAAAGGSTTPVYWNGTGFTACTSYANASVNYATSAGSAGSATNATTAANGNQMGIIATIGGQNTTNYPWRLLAKSVEITQNYVDTEALIVLRQYSDGGRTGILKIAFRTNEIATTASSASATWLVRYGFAVDDVKVALYWVAGKSYADIFLKATAWNRMEMHVVRNRSWEFVSSNEGTDGADPVNAYASIDAAATAIHGRAYSSVSNSTDGGTVSYANTAGSANTANSATTAGSADSVAWLNVTGKPSTFAPSAHDHAWSDITSGVPDTATRWPSWSEITSKPASKTAWGQTYLDSSSAFQSISGNMTSVGDISFSASGKKIGGFLWFDTTNQRLGVGTSSPSYPLHVVGDGYFSGNMLCHHVLQGVSSIEFRAFENTSGIGGWLDFHFDGSATADYSSRIAEYASGVITLEGSFVATGAVSALSDARDKRVIGEVPLTVEQIAQMPAVVFEWKNTKHHDDRQHIGTLAQPWQKVLPQAIMPTHDDRLSFDYASAAMVSVIKLAQRLVKLEGIMKSYGFKF